MKHTTGIFKYFTKILSARGFLILIGCSILFSACKSHVASNHITLEDLKIINNCNVIRDIIKNEIRPEADSLTNKFNEISREIIKDPLLNDCPEFTHVLDWLNDDLLKYKKSIDEIDNNMALIIASFIKMGFGTENTLPDVDLNLNNYKESNIQQIKFVNNKNVLMDISNKTIESDSLNLRSIKDELEKKARQVYILSYNLNNEIFSTKYNSFSFPSGEYDKNKIRNTDIRQFKDDMKTLTEIYNSAKISSGLDIKIIVLTCGYSDLSSVSDTKIKTMVSDEKYAGMMNLPKEEKVMEANKILSQLRAISVSEFITSHLSEINSINNNNLKTCFHGFGIQKPDAGSVYLNSKNDPKRRVVKCFYHIVGI